MPPWAVAPDKKHTGGTGPDFALVEVRFWSAQDSSQLNLTIMALVSETLVNAHVPSLGQRY